jgi:polyhydroxyalkanoate synthesis regulator phasin
MNPITPKVLSEYSHFTELVDEAFHGITHLIPPASIIFGGVPRDLAAGMPLVGDLDIATSKEEYHHLADTMNKHPRWKPCDGPSPQPKRDIFARKSPYENSNLPLGKVANFENGFGCKIQIIAPKTRGYESYLEQGVPESWILALEVDFICCGIIITSHGETLELVDGADTDCRNRVLRINRLAQRPEMHMLAERVDKLTKRGWQNRINVEKEQQNLEKRRVPEKESKDLKFFGAGPVGYNYKAKSKLAQRPEMHMLAERVDKLTKRGWKIGARPAGYNYKAKSKLVQALYTESPKKFSSF